MKGHIAGGGRSWVGWWGDRKSWGSSLLSVPRGRPPAALPPPHGSLKPRFYATGSSLASFYFTLHQTSTISALLVFRNRAVVQERSHKKQSFVTAWVNVRDPDISDAGGHRATPVTGSVRSRQTAAGGLGAGPPDPCAEGQPCRMRGSGAGDSRERHCTVSSTGCWEGRSGDRRPSKVVTTVTAPVRGSEREPGELTVALGLRTRGPPHGCASPQTSPADTSLTYRSARSVVPQQSSFERETKSKTKILPGTLL